MNDSAAHRLSAKLHELWDGLDDEERHLLVGAVNGDEGAEVQGFAQPFTFGQLLPPAAGFMDYTDDGRMDQVVASKPTSWIQKSTETPRVRP